MDPVAVARVTLLGFFLSTASAGTPPGDNVFSVTANCSADSQPCGPAPSCCAPGLHCNFRRGIPICLDGTITSNGGFTHLACADPYLFPCDVALGIPGFCCQIGTSCFTEGDDNIVHCINAVGTTVPAIPSATTGLIPSATPISSSDSSIIYSPSDAWNVSNSVANCTTSTSLHETGIINATISFNYTGPSIMVRTVSSSSGGVFAVFADSVNTDGLIDTFSGPGDLSLPTCYPIQFPPFITTPPGYENRTNHTLTLVYTGPSALAPEGTNTSIVQFDSFAIPDLNSVLVPTSNQGPLGLQNLNVYIFLVSLTWSLYVLV